MIFEKEWVDVSPSVLFGPIKTFFECALACFSELQHLHSPSRVPNPLLQAREVGNLSTTAPTQKLPTILRYQCLWPLSVLHVWQCLCALPWESVCMTELKTAHPRDPFESNLSSNLFFAHIPIQLPFPTVRVCFTMILFNSSKLSKPWKKAVKCILAPGVDTYHGLILVKAITWRFVFLTILLIEISIIALFALNAQSVKQSTHCVKHKSINKQLNTLLPHYFEVYCRTSILSRTLVQYKIGEQKLYNLRNVHISVNYHTSFYTHGTPIIDI